MVRFRRQTCGLLLLLGWALNATPSMAQSTTAPTPTQRAENYELALARAQATGNDIVVYQRGSDWNLLAETLYHTVWLKEQLLQELGPGFILVAVDHPEGAGGRSVYGAPTEATAGTTPPQRLAELTDEKNPLPPNEITAVESKDGATFKTREDSAWLASGANPNQDTLTLKIKARHAGTVLRLDFPTDPTLPGTGPGRASNGNFAICEVEAQAAATPVKFTAAWASAAEGNQGAWQAIDGISDKGDNVWNPAAHQHHRRSLLLVLAQGVPADGELTLRLICRSQWGQHVPGCLRAAVLSDAPVASDVSAVYQAQLLAAKNARYSWWDTTYCPRVALLDSAGRAVACENKPRLGLTPATLATRIKELRTVRQKRDALWTQAQQATGPARAELLRQSLDLLGFANWAGNDNCYKFIHEKIKEADPKDQSGATRWLSFGANGRDGAPGMDDVWKALNAKDYQAALDLVELHLADPRNKCLDHDRRQRIMLAKFRIYREWKGHEDQRFDVQRQIAALDPATYLGIGAVGYLAMYHRTATPLITYGWGETQVKPGPNTWDMNDTNYYFDHPGIYKVTLTHAGGKDSVTIRRLTVHDGTTTLAEATPSTPAATASTASPAAVGPGHNATFTLDLRRWRPDRHYLLHVELEANPGQTDNKGNFNIEPEFMPPATVAAASAPASDTDELSQNLRGDLAAWQKKLGDTVLAQTPDIRSAAANILANPAQRLFLAQAELLRTCTPAKVAQVAAGDDGIPFLKDLLTNTSWLESFLASGPADRAAALENLRFLHQYAPADLAQPLFKNLATAMALSAGADFPRYRLFQRFKHIQWAWRNGLLHAAFDHYTVREMRFAIYLGGTARDYQFLLDERQTTIGDYFGACWAIPYRDPNDYGYSVQGWGYTDPWRYYYGAGYRCRPLEAQRLVGGVCGTLSEYGASTAQAHGVMSVTVGQPGHCAYVVRAGESWGIGNDVFGPCDTGFSAWGWEGTGYSVAASLWEPVEADRTHFMDATRLTWVAHIQQARSTDKTPGSWAATYEQSLLTQPLNYGLWVEYVKALEATPTVPLTTWRSLARRAADTFAPWHQPAWALANRCFEKAAATLKPPERLTFLLELHRALRQEKATQLASYHYESNFEWQANHLGDPALEIQFFRELLVILHSKEPQYNGFLSGLLSWGANRFSGKPATAAAYARAMDAFFAAQGKAADRGQVVSTLATGIRKAADTSDLATYQLWGNMALRLLPPLTPEDVYLNAAQVKDFPKTTGFPGELLSREAMLRTSSTSAPDRPQTYRQLLSGSSFGGFFHTGDEATPWAQVELSAASILSGIVLVNRFEAASERAAPLKVSVSDDGKTWTAVADFDKPLPVFRIDLQGKAVHARFVRLERVAETAAAFHFRSILIYGHKVPPVTAATGQLPVKTKG